MGSNCCCMHTRESATSMRSAPTPRISAVVAYIHAGRTSGHCFTLHQLLPHVRRRSGSCCIQQNNRYNQSSQPLESAAATCTHDKWLLLLPVHKHPNQYACRQIGHVYNQCTKCWGQCAKHIHVHIREVGTDISAATALISATTDSLCT